MRRRALPVLRPYTVEMSQEGARQDAKERPTRDQKSQALSAADCAERVLAYFENAFPADNRPRRAIEAARAWARGEIRVGEARAAALAAHAAARGAAAAGQPAACAAARAAGHAAATAHVATHARAVTFYAKKAWGHTKTRDRDASKLGPRP